MIDFNALMNNKGRRQAIDPIEIFAELPKSNKINDLYKVQGDILNKWHTELREKPNIVIQLNTGGGKTLLGLLMALSVMRETEKGVLYLVENRQLAEQVVDEASAIGIPAKAYYSGAASDPDFNNGESILIGAYQALFNGQSAFGVQGTRKRPSSLGGIIIDDAHASLDAVKKVFTLEIPSDSEFDLYKKILSEFRTAFNHVGRINTYYGFCDGSNDDIMEIPYEFWISSLERVSSHIRKKQKEYDGDDERFRQLLFQWPLIKDNLHFCQVIVSKRMISIVPLYPLIHMIPTFKNADRRIYMSATITDYGDMVRTFDLRNLPNECIIAPKTVSGVGRRLMLSASSDLLESNEFGDLVKEQISKKRGVIKLSPRVGLDFSQIVFREPLGHDSVMKAIKDLNGKQAETAISFVNRYNGIDLPEDACRILIMQDLPTGLNDIESLAFSYLPDSTETAQRIAQKIEQGVGRGVRGASDHCAVIFTGERLVSWMKQKRNRSYFSTAFRAQLEMGELIAEEIYSPSDFCDVLKQEINSDESWKKYHAAELAKCVSDDKCESTSYELACFERRAFALWIEGKHNDASSLIEQKITEYTNDESYQGWMLGIAARMAFDGKEYDRARLLSQKAHSCNRAIWLLDTEERLRDSTPVSGQARAIIKKINDLHDPVAVLQQFDRETACLNFASSYREFENSLKCLGMYLGFDSSKADNNGEGPDVYWLDKSIRIGCAFEAKNEKKANTPLHKKEAGQLRTAQAWLQQKYPTIEIKGVSVHPNQVADPNASAWDLLALTPANLSELHEQARLLLEEAVKHRNPNRIDQVIREQKMNLESICIEYFTPFITL